jgi:uncharacterized protein with FMN-binding domain
MKKLLKILKWFGISLLVFIAAIMIFAFLGLRETKELEIRGVDLTGIADGEYTGSYDGYRWKNTVIVTVENHVIIHIERVKGPVGREEIALALTKAVLAAQSPDVDAVTGATADSKAFLKAVENALQG